MVPGVHVGLHPEQVLREAQVLGESGRHLLASGEEVGEDRAIRPDQRIGLVDDEEPHGAVVGIDGGLHRVADVVEVGGEGRVRPAQPPGGGDPLGGGRHFAGGRRVREPVGDRVEVLHPHQAPVEHHQVGIGVRVEERRRLGDGVAQVAHQEHLRLGGDLTRDQGVDVGEAQGEGGAAQDRTGLDAAQPVVGVVVDGLLAGRLHRRVDLALLGADDHPRTGGEVFTEVDPGLGDGEQRGHVLLGLDVLHQEVGLSLGGNGVRRTQHRTETVGEHQVAVDPPGVGDAGVVELPGGQHHLGEHPVDVIAVHIDIAELIEGPQLLKLAIGGEQHRRVPQPDVVDGGGVVRQHLGIEFGVGGKGADLDPVEPVAHPGKGDVALHVGELLVDLVGLHREALHHRRPDSA